MFCWQNVAATVETDTTPAPPAPPQELASPAGGEDEVALVGRLDRLGEANKRHVSRIMPKILALSAKITLFLEFRELGRGPIKQHVTC